MTRLAGLLALVLLAAASTAEAKQAAQVCGSTGCAAVTDPGLVGPLRSTFRPTPAPKPAPFYVVRFCAEADCRGPIDWSYRYVPSARAMRADDIGSGAVRWMDASLLAPLLADLTDGLEPYARSRTWTPSRPQPAVPAGPADGPPAWIVLGAIAALIAFTLWRIRRPRPRWRARSAASRVGSGGGSR